MNTFEKFLLGYFILATFLFAVFAYLTEYTFIGSMMSGVSFLGYLLLITGKHKFITKQ